MSTRAQAAPLASGVAPPRPTLRGVFHLAAAVAATAGAAWLLLLADSPRGYVGAAIFAASLVLLYGTSATYHRISWKPAMRRVVKRLDHSMIWILIGGTYTPIALRISDAWGIPILSVVWGLAGAGVLMKLLWPDAPKWISVALYVGLGWLAVVGTSEILAEFAAGPLTLLVLGGVLYTIGGVVYALGRPNPWPRVFGYHEVFHGLVVAGSAVHYSLIAIYVVPS